NRFGVDAAPARASQWFAGDSFHDPYALSAMTRHPTARRVHSSRSEPDDAFVARLLELIAWAKRNTRTLVVSGAVLVVAVAAGFVYVKQQAAVRDAAQSRLGQIQQTVLIGNNVLAIQD